jgi:hypothetical protein
MFKNRKSTTLVALVLVFAILPISAGESRERSTTEQQPMGPYDIALLPLEDVPDPIPEVYRNPFPSSTDSVFARAEVLRVLKDPRKIPIDRFLYYKDPRRQTQNLIYRDPQFQSIYVERNKLYTQVISHPDADLILNHFEDRPYQAIAVYVRATGAYMEISHYPDNEPDNVTTEIIPQLDPFYVRDPVLDFDFLFRYRPGTGESEPYYPNWNPWSYLAVSDLESDLTFPCMPQQVLDIGEPYQNPDTGDMIDPAAYLPPKPWYVSENGQMHEGEVREGWLLCLAPDVPIDDIELVEQRGQGNKGTEPFSTETRSVVWTTPEYKQMGEWHLLPDMQVVAWNGTIADTLAEFNTLDLHEVYRGDVWISVASAFTNDAPPELEGAAFSGMSIQLDFEGMNGLLQTWEHVALKEWLSLEFCNNRHLAECGKADQHFEPSGTMIELPNSCPEESADCPDTHLVRTGGFFNSILADSPGNWIETPILEKDVKDGIDVLLVGLESRNGVVQTNREVPGRILAWHLEPQLIRIPELTTYDICASEKVECLPEKLRYSEDDSENSRINNFDGPLPIIPYGQSANGIRVLEIFTGETAVLEIGQGYALDLRLQESSTVTNDFQWLYVLLEVQSVVNDIHVFHIIEDGVYDYAAGRKAIIYSDIGSYRAIDYGWITQIRKSVSNIGLFGSIPNDTNLDNLILIFREDEGGGPAYELVSNK